MDCCEWALESAHCHCNSGCYTVDRKSTRLNSSHSQISYAVFCLKKKKNNIISHLYIIYNCHNSLSARPRKFRAYFYGHYGDETLYFHHVLCLLLLSLIFSSSTL